MPFHYENICDSFGVNTCLLHQAIWCKHFASLLLRCMQLADPLFSFSFLPALDETTFIYVQSLKSR